MGKTKNKQQVIDLNQTMSIMTLNVNGLNALTKSRDCYIEFKKSRHNYMLPKSNTLQILYIYKEKGSKLNAMLTLIKEKKKNKLNGHINTRFQSKKY